jgi:hypothetical protein
MAPNKRIAMAIGKSVDDLKDAPPVKEKTTDEIHMDVS